MGAGLPAVHLHGSVKTFMHTVIAFFVGLVALVAAAFGTGSLDILVQYAGAVLRDIAPETVVVYLPSAVLFGLLLDGLVGIAASLLVFNRLHFHRWFPRKGTI